MKKVFFIAALFFCACADDMPTRQYDKQLNITILVDLSDRINPALSNDAPPHWQRDIANIQAICELFKKSIKDRGAFMARGKIKVVFTPEPNVANINSMVNALVVNFADMPVKQKKHAYDSLTSTFTKTLTQIYAATIEEHARGKVNWQGSDVWRFFKNDAAALCIDTAYRNILVVLTDGYIYHQNSKFVHGNRYSYLLPENLKKYRNAHWQRQIENDNFGMIAPVSGLENLEVLVLDITPTMPQYDEDILRFVLERWLRGMDVKRCQIHLTNFPTHIKPMLERFFQIIN
jgi:hypothetical protein